jgi:hypothetical protein
MRRVSAFILALAEGISSDLAEHVAPDRLQDEVEKELENQMLAQLVKAIGEYNNARMYGSDHVQQNSKRKQVLRFMGYCNEMWVKTAEVKGALMTGDLESIDFEEAAIS